MLLSQEINNDDQVNSEEYWFPCHHRHCWSLLSFCSLVFFCKLISDPSQLGSNVFQAWGPYYGCSCSCRWCNRKWSHVISSSSVPVKCRFRHRCCRRCCSRHANGIQLRQDHRCGTVAGISSSEWDSSGGSHWLLWRRSRWQGWWHDSVGTSTRKVRWGASVFPSFPLGSWSSQSLTLCLRLLSSLVSPLLTVAALWDAGGKEMRWGGGTQGFPSCCGTEQTWCPVKQHLSPSTRVESESMLLILLPLHPRERKRERKRRSTSLFSSPGHQEE